jgi:hypothetical protein
VTTHCALARTHQSFGWVTCFSSVFRRRESSQWCAPRAGGESELRRRPAAARRRGREVRAMVIAAPRAQAHTPPAPRRLGRAAGFIFLRG